MKNPYLFFAAAVLCLLLSLTELYSQRDTALWNTAQKCFKDKDYITAVENLDKYLLKTTDDAEAYKLRGIITFRMGSHEKACKDFLLSRDMKVKDPFVPITCDKKEQLASLNDFFYKGQKLNPALGYRPYYTMADTIRGMLRPERTCYDVTFYDLTVRINPDDRSIRGKNKITFRVEESTSRIQIDLFDNMNIESINWNNRSLKYERQYNAVFITFPETLTSGSTQILDFSYHGKPSEAVNPPWQGGFVWGKDGSNEWAGVSCEHFGASCWWPCKDHLSDEPDSMRISLEVPKAYQAISNGSLVKTEKAAKGYKRYVWFVHYPINNYNVTFYLGKFVNFSDTLRCGNNVVKLEYYVLAQHLDTAKKCFAQTKNVVRTFNELFGEYPFIRDKFALVESPYSGMEHQNAIAFGSNYGEQYKYYFNKEDDYIIIHEAAHEWWGNSISAGDLADGWIHESFATYAELLYMEKKYGYEKGYLPVMKKYREQVANFWPMIHHYDVNEYSFASNDIYVKGTAVLDNLRCTINNDPLFFKILKDFHLKYKCKVVKTEDFIDFVNEYTHENYTPFFRKMLYDASIPVLAYSYKKEGDHIMLSYRWDGVDKGFKMPFSLRIDGGRNVRLTATPEEQTVKLENTETFNFYTQWSAFTGVDRNSYTLYWTRKDEVRGTK